MVEDDPMNGTTQIKTAAAAEGPGKATEGAKEGAVGEGGSKVIEEGEVISEEVKAPEEKAEEAAGKQQSPPQPSPPTLPADDQPESEVNALVTQTILSLDNHNNAIISPPSPNSLAQSQALLMQPSASSSSSPTQSSAERPLNVTDALSYLDHVKVQFHDQPDVYNHFLDIMKEFKSQQIDTPGVIKRVSHLFQGHPILIQGFNTFLPAGYRIECSMDAKQITVTTPRGTTMQTTGGGRGKTAFSWSMTEPGESVAKPTEITIPPQHPATPEPAPAPPPPAPAPAPAPATTTAATSTSNASQQPRVIVGGGPLAGMAQQQAMEPAVAYVQKIKQRCDPEVYKQFLDILSRYHHAPETIDEEEVSRQIARLFKNAPDLRADFRIFMPDQNQGYLDDTTGLMDDPHFRIGTPDVKGKRKLDAVASGSSQPQKKKRRAGERGRERERGRAKEMDQMSLRQSSRKSKTDSSSRYAAAGGSASDRRGGAGGSSGAGMMTPAQGPAQIIPPRPVPPPNDPIHFFDRVKRAIDSRETYNEFLKVINLFTQGYIDTATLVKESQNFLVGDGELMKQFKEILGWDERKERESWLFEQQLTERGMQGGWSRPTIAVVNGGGVVRPGKVDLNVQYGSYRRLPADEINVSCSGRDEMCRSVLNDEWVSHPSWASEETGFIVNKKNVYEEALHRSEEERHEYDFHIEAIARTIAILEPLANKIAVLNTEEKNGFKISRPNLGGSAKAIHHRVIKKIYGREAGMDVIQAMQDTPAFAIPVVLSRLKQKEEEWKRGQREWHKVWREVDSRNYAKSLDQQCISFKIADKKALTTKAFVNQIEVAREEQMAKRASLIDPLFARTRPRHQLEFMVGDTGTLQDGVKLVVSFLDRTQGQIQFSERKRIEGFLRSFVPLFFCLDGGVFNAAFTVVSVLDASSGSGPGVGGGGVDASDVSDDGTSDVEMGSVVSGVSGRSGSKGKKGGNAGNDLRKKLLAKSTTNRRTRAQEAASPSISRVASPAPSQQDEEAKVDPVTPGPSRRGPKKNTFHTNTVFYVLLRLLEVLYSRLTLFKTISQKLSQESVTEHPNPIAETLNLLPSTPNGMVNGLDKPSNGNGNHLYELMLESCERLFDNEIEQTSFEDQMRHMFGIKEAYKIFTIDKLIGVIIKQVQLVFTDAKSSELLEVLKRDRALPSFTTQDQLNSRRSAEKILGPDENIFRIDWLSETKKITVQLIGKDDSRFENSEVLTERWQTYIDSYVSEDTSAGVPTTKPKSPFLRRNLPPSLPTPEIQDEASTGSAPASPSPPLPTVLAQDNLEIKICVRTYRLFFVPGTEDYLFTIQDLETTQKSLAHIKVRDELRRKWSPDSLGGGVNGQSQSNQAQAVDEAEAQSAVVVVPGTD
ncbi:hypothetical protein PM082_006339 [Marasmius tenuissimus]|nr:hypothetical protein PM082_006339 [Marasmius tenuissimus]